jgi:UDP-N-acetylmuramyl tripeptide synthase
MKSSPQVQAERDKAVAAAIAMADARDVILLAGKGHEPYQEIAGMRHPYSDLDAAKSALVARGVGS